MATVWGEWVQGIHARTSNVEVEVVDAVPVLGVWDAERAVRIEPCSHSAFLAPEQARHLASVLMRAADVAEAG